MHINIVENTKIYNCQNPFGSQLVPNVCMCIFDQWNTFEKCITNIENQQFQLPILFRLLDARIGLVPVKLHGYHLKTTPLLLLFRFTLQNVPLLFSISCFFIHRFFMFFINR